ncbi:MAG: imidazoleglycerol-phosphate dehydratase [Candidatus Omnitrophica bacterium]|nr:imidazoleglycerol-phosphate dehydratase [Candidatus Omnitrophota bacterium]
MSKKTRKVVVPRKTTETDIVVKLNIDGAGKSKISTGIGLLDHMLELFAFYGVFDLEIAAKGDLKVDIHHTNEDVGIVLGQAFKKALDKKISIGRFGFFSVPMEEVVANVVLDISGRDLFKFTILGKFGEATQSQGGYDLNDAKHFFEAFAKHLGANLQVTLNNTDPMLHTTLEPIFKALGIALRQATQIDPRRKGIPSTKGIID